MRVGYALVLVGILASGCTGNGSISYGNVGGTGSSSSSIAGSVGASTSTGGVGASSTTGGIGATTSSPTTAAASGSGGTAGGSLCGSSDLCTVYASSDTDLYQVDPTTNPPTQTHLCAFSGALTSSDTVTDIATESQGTLFAITETDLYTVDPASNCAATHVASLSGTATTRWVCLSFSATGTLLASDEDGNVVTINTTTGAITAAGSFGNGMGCSGDFVAVNAGTELTAPTIFATATQPSGTGTGNDQLVTLDSTNGYTATILGDTGYKAIYGLGYVGGTLYGFTHAGQTLQINPSTGASTVLTTTSPVAAFSGGATTPLAPQMPVFQ